MKPMNFDEEAKRICIEHFKTIVSDPNGLTQELQKIISLKLQQAYEKGREDQAEEDAKIARENLKSVDVHFLEHSNLKTINGQKIINGQLQEFFLRYFIYEINLEKAIRQSRKDSGK